MDALPEAADLLALAVAGGLTVTAALATAGRWTPGPVGEALRRVTDEIAMGRPAAEAIDDLATRARGAGPGPRRRAAGVRALRGAPRRRPRAGGRRGPRWSAGAGPRKQARRLPVLLLFPLVLCVLPAFGLLTVVPLLVGSLPDLPL